MAEKAESKVTKIHGADLAERATLTFFGIARDVRGEINQRILGALQLIESSQLGALKLARSIDERVDKLAEDVIDSTESMTLGVIRTLREAGQGVSSLATTLTRPRENVRAA